jgi:hypothetical protein
MKNKYNILERNGHYEIIFGSNTTVLYGGGLESVKVKEIAELMVDELNLIDCKEDDVSNGIIFRAYRIFNMFAYSLNFTIDLCEFCSDVYLGDGTYLHLLKFGSTDMLIIRELYAEFDETMRAREIADWATGLIDTDDFIDKYPAAKKFGKERLDLIKAFMPLFRSDSKRTLERDLNFRFVSYTVKHRSYDKSIETNDKKELIESDNILDILVDSDTVTIPANTFEFKHDNILEAREEAVALALKIKKEAFSYKGIELILNYQRYNSRGEWKDKKYKILSGSKMGTDKILPSLREEAALIINMGRAFPMSYVNYNDKEYFKIRHYPNSLYYFTA